MSTKQVVALNCPFCGASAQIEPWHGGSPDRHLVSCSNGDGCQSGPMAHGETFAEAVSNWNRRHPDEFLPLLDADSGEQATTG